MNTAGIHWIRGYRAYYDWGTGSSGQWGGGKKQKNNNKLEQEDKK